MMTNGDNILDQLELNNHIRLEDIPDIDLYIDQVIQLFELKHETSKRYEDEKIITKTMINNYAKEKLFFPVKNKKYSKEHLILISLIYELKGTLSMKDIKALLHILNEKIVAERFPIDSFYESYLHLSDENVEKFERSFHQMVDHVHEQLNGTEDELLKDVLVAASLANMSHLYRRVTEKVIDEIMNRKKEVKKDE